MLGSFAQGATSGIPWVAALHLRVMTSFFLPTVDAQEPVLNPSLEPMCQGSVEEAPCWSELTNRPGCHV